MDKRLAHLSEKEINELIEAYYNGEKVKSLIDKYNLNIRPSQLVKLFPPKIIDEQCPYCDVNLIIKYTSRDYNRNNNTPTCPSCGHENNGFCWCENCQKKDRIRAQNERQEKRNMLNHLLEIDDSGKIDFADLTFDERVYLGAFLREGISEDFNFIKPLDAFINPLAPTQDYTKEIFNILQKQNLIIIHPDSDVDDFEDIDFETGNFKYYPERVKWALNIKKDGLNKVPLIESIINPTDLEFPDEAYTLWRKISLYEALEYFYHSVNNVLDVKYNPGDKTISVINDLLNDYSVSQIYTIIYRATNNALRFQVEKEVSRKYAANTIIGNAQSFAERAKINKWDIQRYNRLKECPESALSKFFFERVLKIGYAGFNEKPRVIIP